MLIPNRTKYRKVRKGRIKGHATSGNYIAFGAYALQAQESERITSRQIEASRQAMTRHIKRGGQIWIRIFPHTPVTKKPQDVKMGSGKGSPEYFAAKVRPGTILFEMDGVAEDVAPASTDAGHVIRARGRHIEQRGVHDAEIEGRALAIGHGAVGAGARVVRLSDALHAAVPVPVVLP